MTLIIAALIFLTMWVWYEARKIKNALVEFVPLEKYAEVICDVSRDTTIPKYATHLIYLTSAYQETEVENKIIYSILQKQPKRADLYWLVHVDVIDEPYTLDYRVTQLVKDKLFMFVLKLASVWNRISI